MARRKKTDARCRKCGCPGPETFWYMRDRYCFDVDRAREIVADGREPVEIDEADVKFSVDTSTIDWNHVPHVKTEYPGIIAFIYFKNDDGELLKAHLLIDGHHRAARCLQLGDPFRAYLLSEDESLAILERAPKNLPGRQELLAVC